MHILGGVQVAIQRRKRKGTEGTSGKSETRESAGLGKIPTGETRFRRLAICEVHCECRPAGLL